MKAVIFGTGECYHRYKSGFKNMDIVGVLDNNVEKWNTYIDGYPIYSPESIQHMDFDYVFLVSIHYKEMRKQLIELGVSEDKIIDEEHLLFFRHLVVKESYMFPECESANGEKKRILLISHVLNLTGAPVVFCRLAHVLKQNGYEVSVYSEKHSNLKHGDLLYKLLKDGISVVLYNDLKTLSIADVKEKFDVFWVNTITLYHIVEKLLPLKKEIFWWLHETDDYYDNLKERIRFPQGENLQVFSVGWMAAQSYEKYSGYNVTGILEYGIPEIIRGTEKITERLAKISFGLVGVHCERKGQDVLFSAILQENKNWEEIAEFYFVGSMPQSIVEEYEKVSNVHCLGEVAPEKLSSIYENLDVLICPSRFDPMPVVVSEAMQHKKVCLVTDKVGQCRYITDGYNGLICKSDSVSELVKKINWIIDNRSSLEEIGERGSKICEEHFSMKAFEKNVLEIMQGY